MEQQIVEKSLDEFDTLTINSVFEVHLIQGTTNSIKLEGAKKILGKINYTVENNKLTIENTFNGNWMHPAKNKIKIYLTVNNLCRINVYETCNIVTDNTLTGDEIGLVMASKLNEATLDLNCNTFYYWNNFPCGGKITLRGTTNQLKIWNVALMAVDASALIANHVEVDNASKGDCKVTSLLNLTYKISGEGNLYLKGNPPSIVKIEESSTGKLILE